MPGAWRLSFCRSRGKPDQDLPRAGIRPSGRVPEIRDTGGQMAQIVVGMADCRISDAPGEVLATYALGSCIGLMVHDPIRSIGGLLHFMLPDSSIDPRSEERRVGQEG